jgi:hypothetical protein
MGTYIAMPEPYMLTYTGRKVNPLNLRREDVDIRDIAHALACCNRFAGHARYPISVAQHSVNVSLLCDSLEDQLQGLLHDGSEAYLGDMTKWLKASDAMVGYREAEARAQAAVYTKWGCAAQDSLAVTLADDTMVRWELQLAFGDKAIFPVRLPRLSADEAFGLQNRLGLGWGSSWKWAEAEAQFLNRYNQLIAVVTGSEARSAAGRPDPS